MKEKNDRPQARGPFALRMFIWVGAALFAVLLIWLLSFILRDAGKFRDIDYRAIETQFISQEVRDNETTLSAQLVAVGRKIQAGERRNSFLKQRVDTSRTTMNQMLDLQRLNLERNQAMNEEQLQAVARAQKIFLDNQEAYQQKIEDIEQLSDRKADLEAQLADLQTIIRGQQGAVQRAYSKQQEIRDLQAAFLKIALLLPFIALAIWLFVKRRSTVLAPLVYAADAAVLYRLILVIHEHFPSRYFKYIFLGMAILVVLKVMLVLIKLAVSPSVGALLKRYRKSYSKGRCPVCDYPILRGISKLAHTGYGLPGGVWGFLSGKRVRLGVNPDDVEDEPYTCPSCGTGLFETCEKCGAVRHSLLSNCLRCGAEGSKPTPEPAS